LLKLLTGKGFDKIPYSGTLFESTLAQNPLYDPDKTKTISQTEILACGSHIFRVHYHSWHYLQNLKLITMLLTILLVLTGLAGFAVFFKSIDFFDKI